MKELLSDIATSGPENGANMSKSFVPDIEQGEAAIADPAAAAEATTLPSLAELNAPSPAPIPAGASGLVNLFAPPSNGTNNDGAIVSSTSMTTGDDDEDRIPRRQSACFTETWRRAGSTFNKYPQTLIAALNELQKVKLEHLDHLPRLVQRNRAFHQSSNKVYIRHNQGTRIYKLLRFNWFHVFLRWPTKLSLTVLMSVWTGAILVFAGLYMCYDSLNVTSECGLGGSGPGDVIHFAGAFAFSLETCTTVGYGLPNGINSFFEQGCSGLQVIIYFQMAWSMLFNAFLITFLYNRLGRSETRSTQVIFSNKALVSIVDGQVRFQVRLFDCDAKHPVVEAHIRMYCIMKHRPVPRPLRIVQPDDELGGMLFLSFPSVVSHTIDMYSLLHPPVPTMLTKPKGLVLRQADGFTANRDDIVCPICGESYGTFERWTNHVRYTQIVERQDDYPAENTHLSLDLAEIDKEFYREPLKDIQGLKSYFDRNVSEILCLVEGIDPMQSGTFQALQSYRFEDVEWENYAQFSPCLSVERVSFKSKNEIFVIDLDRYHEILPDPEAEANAKEEEELAKEEEALWHQPLTGPAPVQKKHAKAKPVRHRHRRIKTLSSGISDSIFANK